MYDNRASQQDQTIFLLDILVTTILFVFSFFFRNLIVPQGEIDLVSHIFLLPLLLTLLLSSFQYFGAYKNPGLNSLAMYFSAILKSIIVSIGLLLCLLFLVEVKYVSRLVIFLFSIFELIGIFSIRFFLTRYFEKTVKSGENKLRILIIGTGDRAMELTRQLNKNSEVDAEIVGYLDPQIDKVYRTVVGDPVLGSVNNISEVLKSRVVDEVIIAVPRSMLSDAEPIASACEEEGIKLRFMADVFDVNMARISLAQIGEIPLLTMESVAQDEGKLFAKRVFDFTLTMLAMPFVLPLCLCVAIAIKLDSPGPVLFIQQRVGLRKHLFPMFKFRSMHEDAEKRMKEIEHLNEAEGPIFKMANDPRVTKVGHFIRRTSLDELPQLFNVLRGEMSLVGPRPMSIRDVDLFNRGIQRKRFSVKPGITCLWQISGRSSLPFEKWLELDLQYIEKWSFWLDIVILVKTIPAVLWSKGAY